MGPTAVDYQEVDFCESTCAREVFDKVTLVVCYQCQVSIIRIYNLMSVPRELKLFWTTLNMTSICGFFKLSGVTTQNNFVEELML